MSTANEITRLNNAKEAIAAAITEKGVTVPSGTKLDGMASLIGQIETGGGGEMISGQISTGAEAFTVHFTDESGYHCIEDVAVQITCPKDSLIFIEEVSYWGGSPGGSYTGVEILKAYTYEKYFEVFDGYETYADVLVRVKDNGFTIYP